MVSLGEEPGHCSPDSSLSRASLPTDEGHPRLLPSSLQGGNWSHASCNSDQLYFQWTSVCLTPIGLSIAPKIG